MNVIRTRTPPWTRATWQYATIGTMALAIVATWALVDLPHAQAATPQSAEEFAQLSPSCSISSQALMSSDPAVVAKLRADAAGAR
jgi:hypothetical protein